MTKKTSPANTTAKQPQMPGGAAEPNADASDDPANTTDQANTGDEGGKAMVSLSLEDLETLVDKKIAQRDARRAKNARGPGVEEKDLPDASEIDPSKIERAVLTKDGYVVPKATAADKVQQLRNVIN